MTGWILIFALLVLGGVLATLGDRLGSLVGKARLSIFNLRPRRTAVLITVLTGSLISAVSLGLMLLVSRQLRVGLFQLDELQSRINSAENELKQRESNLIAFRRGDVVLGSGQPLATATISLEKPNQARQAIDRLLQEANFEAFRRVLPGEKPNRQILLVPRGDIQRLESVIKKEGTWVVNIRSAANVLLGEKSVFAFPEIRPNALIAKQGEVIAKIILQENERTSDLIGKKIKLLLAATLSEVKRRGSLTSGLQFDANTLNQLGKDLLGRSKDRVTLEAISLRNSDIADQISIVLKVKENLRKNAIRD